MNTLNQTNKRDKFIWQLLVYSAAFVVMALGVYFVFYYCGRTFLQDADGNIDGIAQQYPIYTKIKHIIGALLAGQGFDFWSWDLGLGDDSFIEFNGKLLNPLTYICIAFPYKYLDIGYCVMTVCSQYLTGVAFMVFSRGVDIRGNRVIMGGLCYSFSAWIIYSLLRQCSFTTVAILLPLMILGVDKILRKESPALFIVTVALHLLYGVLWAYIDAIIVVLYFLVRYFWYNKGESISTFFKMLGAFMAYGIVGVSISTVVIIQNLFKYGNATTGSTVEKYAFFAIKDYLTYPAGFFHLDTVQEPYSVITLPIICIVLLPMLIGGIKQGRTASILGVGFFIASLFPITGSILNGFSYSVGRWFFIIAFFLVWATMEMATKEVFISKLNVGIMLSWILALGIWNVGICYVILDIISYNSAICTCIGVVLGFIIIILCHNKARGREINLPIIGRRGLSIAILLVVMLSTMGYTNMLFLPGINTYIYKVDMVGAAKAKLDSSSQHIIPEIQQSDRTFYRTDQVDGYSDTRIARVRANENIYFGNRSIYTYFSSMNSGWHRFNKIVGNNAGYFDRTTSYSNDNRAGLDFLFGVKYFVGDSETKKPGASEYAPYGFAYDRTIDGVDVLKNKYCMGLGTAYDKYITESELMNYSELEREQILLQAAVIPDTQAGELEGIKHAKLTELKTDYSTIDYSLKSGERATLGEKKFTIQETKDDEGGHFTVTIPEVRNQQVVIAFKHLIREKCNYVEAKSLRVPKSDAINLDTPKRKLDNQAYRDNEKFEILLTYGNVQKAGQCRKSKNQGFSDVEDYYINLGYFDSISGDIDVYIDRLGEYSYDDLVIYTIPMDIYEENAQILQDNSFDITSYEHDVVEGTFNIKENSIMYFSILDNAGWHIYVDGNKVEKLHDVNITFTGALIDAGKHEVKLVYETPGLKIGGMISLLGIVTLIIIILVYRKKNNSELKGV